MLYDWPKTGIVIPCFNEGKRIRREKFTRFLMDHGTITFCFVNDGSEDDTQTILEEIADAGAGQVSLVKLSSNRGKGEAVRAGILRMISEDAFQLLGYWDADLSAPLDEIPRLVEGFEQRPTVQFIMGSRIRRMGARVERTWYRHYLGRVFATVASLVLRLPVYDTQCGAKLLSAALAKNVFDESFVTKWLFDVELLARSKLFLGKEEVFESILEIPLSTWIDCGRSKLTLWQYFVQSPIDLVKIYRKYGSFGAVCGVQKDKEAQAPAEK